MNFMKFLYVLLVVPAVISARHPQFDQTFVEHSARTVKHRNELPACNQTKTADCYTASKVIAKTANLMQGKESHNVTQLPLQAKRALTRTPGVPTIGTSFLADDSHQSNVFGASAEGAVGSTQFLHTNAGRVRSFNKTTGQPDGVLNLTLQRFFAPVLEDGGFNSDVGCVYDSFAERWYIICDAAEAASSAGLMLAISDNGNGTGDPITQDTVWHYIIVDQQNNPAFSFAPLVAEFDYSTIGFDQNNIYCAINVLQSTITNGGNPNYFSSNVYVIPKATAVTGGSPTIYAFRELVNQDTLFGPVYNWPVINYDANQTTAFFVGTNTLDFYLDDSFQFLITEVDLTTMTISAPISLAVNEYVFGFIFSTQPLGTPASHPVVPVVGFINGEAHKRNNQIYMIQNVCVDATGASTAETAFDRYGLRFYQVDVTTPATPSLVNSGALFDSSTMMMSYMTPAWMSNSAGNLLLGATQFSPTTYLDAIVAQVDPTTFAPSTVVPYGISTTSYYATEDWTIAPFARWGDHTRVSLDPNGTTFWACQQWCSDTNTWGVQVAQVTAN